MPESSKPPRAKAQPDTVEASAATVAVVGLGYVGLPLAVEFGKKFRTIGFDLSDSLHNKAAGGGRDYPRLEGIKINGVWGVIYSRYDIGCALEGHSGSGCKGFTYESALKIAANVVLYATMP